MFEKTAYKNRLHYLEKIIPFVDTNLIKVIVGQRRVGKSYFLFQLIDYIKEIHPQAHIIYINKENIEFADLKDFKNLYDYIETRKQLEYLEQAYFVFKAQRTELIGKNIFESGEKYYFEDMGLKNAAIHIKLDKFWGVCIATFQVAKLGTDNLKGCVTCKLSNFMRVAQIFNLFMPNRNKNLMLGKFLFSSNCGSIRAFPTPKVTKNESIAARFFCRATCIDKSAHNQHLG